MDDVPSFVFLNGYTSSFFIARCKCSRADHAVWRSSRIAAATLARPLARARACLCVCMFFFVAAEVSPSACCLQENAFSAGVWRRVRFRAACL